MIYVYDVRMVVSDEWRESLHAPARWRRETKYQSCLEKMHCGNETETW